MAKQSSFISPEEKNPDPIIIFKTKLGLTSNRHEAFKRRSQFAE